MDYINHTQEGIERLLSQYHNRYRISQLLKSILLPKQELEDQIQAVTYCLLFDSADTERLNILGKILDLPRGTLGDEIYSLLLKGKIAQNNSNGRANDVLNLLAIIDPTARYSESQAATIRIISGLTFTGANNWEFANAYEGLIRRTKPAGVSYEIHDITYSQQYFSFDDSDFPLSPIPFGFGDIDDMTEEPIFVTGSGALTNLLNY